MRRLAFLVFYLCSSVSGYTQVATQVINPPIAGGNFGYDLVGLGDLDGDGKSDFAVGAPRIDIFSGEAGMVFVFSGATNTQLYALPSLVVGARFGHSLANAGDIDQDGKDDLLVGAPGPSTLGSVMLFSGVDGSLIWSIQGQSVGSELGYDVDCVGDTNGDGVSDFVVGSPGSTTAGRVDLISGSDGSTLRFWHGGVSGDRAGQRVCGLGDQNGDSVPDVAFTVHFNADVLIYSSTDGSFIRSLRPAAFSSFQSFGEAIDDAGDVDGDGRRDVIVGAPLEYYSIYPEAEGGIVRVFSGMDGHVIFEIPETLNNSRFGRSVAGIGDYDGDGVADFAAGARSDFYMGGILRLFSGADGRVLDVFHGDYNEQIAVSIASIDDLDGDGRLDILAGCGTNNLTGQTDGSVLVISGRNWKPVSGAFHDCRFGHALANVGDINLDGWDDYAAGDLSHAGTLWYAGGVTLISGKDGERLHRVVGSRQSGYLGFALVEFGDQDGDGFQEIIVGEPSALGIGSVRIFALPSMTQSLQIDSPTNSSHFGAEIARLKDLNADGIPEIAVGTPSNAQATPQGEVSIHSGSDGSLLFQFSGTNFGGRIGHALEGLDDIDADGVPDWMLGVQVPSGFGASNGKVVAVSGATGATIYEVSQQDSNRGFATELCLINDTDGDGVRDVAVAEPNGVLPITVKGRVRIVSGTNGATLRILEGDLANDQFGRKIARVGDINGDLVSDFAICSPSAIEQSGRSSGLVRVYSGRDCSVLLEARGDFEDSCFGFSFADIGDVNADGYSDLVVAAPDWSSAIGDSVGRIQRVISDALPSISYTSSNLTTLLDLVWNPGADPQSLTGELECYGATPFATGLACVSFAAADSPIFGTNVPILVAVDPTNLILVSQFGFDDQGEFFFPNVSRLNPYIAGSQLHIQYFEVSPNLSSSNAVRLDIVP